VIESMNRNGASCAHCTATPARCVVSRPREDSTLLPGMKPEGRVFTCSVRSSELVARPEYSAVMRNVSTSVSRTTARASSALVCDTCGLGRMRPFAPGSWPSRRVYSSSRSARPVRTAPVVVRYTERSAPL
jgi:hypothetical protein